MFVCVCTPADYVSGVTYWKSIFEIENRLCELECMLWFWMYSAIYIYIYFVVWAWKYAKLK
jgi:hypothetical protein